MNQPPDKDAALKQVNIDVFKCAKGGGPCLGGVTLGTLNSNPHKCDEGYDDGQSVPFCGVCDDSYSMKSGACVGCGGVEVLGILVRLAIGLVLLGILGCIMRTAPFEVYFAVFKIAWPRFKQLLAILITNYQVRCVWTYLAPEHIFGLKIPNGSELSEPDKSKRIILVRAGVFHHIPVDPP